MKKYIYFILLFLIINTYLINNRQSYAYNDCIIELNPPEVTTNNLEKYLIKNDLNINRFCSYDKCYDIREDTYKMSIINFKKIYDKYLSEDEYLELNIKGYPITKIIINTC